MRPQVLERSAIAGGHVHIDDGSCCLIIHAPILNASAPAIKKQVVDWCGYSKVQRRTANFEYEMCGKRGWGDLVRQLMLIGFALVLLSGGAHADDKAIIDRVKSTWRAQDETAEQIIAKASKVAHFVPRGWEAGKADGRDLVTFSWARRSTDQTGDKYTINWEIAPDGTMSLGPPYAKTMELGWVPFALSLVAMEIVDEEKRPNLRFLRDLSNFNFVTTAQGKLGDLLKIGRCTIADDPVGVAYVATIDDKHPDNGDFWDVRMQVNCNIPGPEYLTREGVIIFTKREKQEWRPESFFARRIATHAPGSWFDQADPQEQATFDAAHKAFERSGIPTQGVQSPFPK
jgi:hypothetical protein